MPRQNEQFRDLDASIAFLSVHLYFASVVRLSKKYEYMQLSLTYRYDLAKMHIRQSNLFDL